MTATEVDKETETLQDLSIEDKEEQLGEKKKKKSKKDKKEKDSVRKKYILESLTQSEKEYIEDNDKLRALIRSKLASDVAERLIKKCVSKTAPPPPPLDEEKSKSKKAVIEYLQIVVKALKKENGKLKQAVKGYIGEETEKPEKKTVSFSLPEGSEDNKFLEELQAGDQNFCVTDPNMPDNPIVYATQGFLDLTGYSLDDILGRNCRFLQGPETAPEDVEKIRLAIKDGEDVSMCLLNYKADGSTFWNLFHISALRDAEGNVINFIGIQCQVDADYASEARKHGVVAPSQGITAH